MRARPSGKSEFAGFSKCDCGFFTSNYFLEVQGVNDICAFGLFYFLVLTVDVKEDINIIIHLQIL